MENLTKALSAKKLEDLVVAPKVKVSKILEPTEAEIEQIFTLLQDGTPYKEIRKTVRRVVMDKDKQVSAKGFSYGQIKEIEMGIKAKIVELTPKPVVEDVKEVEEIEVSK